MSAPVPSDRVRAWTLSRQFLGGHRASSPLDVLRRLVGVYSSHPSAPLSIAARVESFDVDEFRRLDVERLGRRLPAMRTSAHLVDATEAAMVLAATPAPAAQRAWRLREAGVDAAEYEGGVEIDVDSVDVLPLWDMYTMGYPSSGRGRIAPSTVLDRLYDDVGNGLGVVLVGGNPVAAWGSRHVSGALHVTLDIISPPLGGRLLARLEERFAAVADVLGSSAAVLDTTGERRPNPLGGTGKRARYGS